MAFLKGSGHPLSLVVRLLALTVFDPRVIPYGQDGDFCFVGDKKDLLLTIGHDSYTHSTNFHLLREDPDSEKGYIFLSERNFFFWDDALKRCGFPKEKKIVIKSSLANQFFGNGYFPAIMEVLSSGEFVRLAQSGDWRGADYVCSLLRKEFTSLSVEGTSFENPTAIIQSLSSLPQ